MSILSAEDRNFWAENGYVVIHNAVPPEHVKAVAGTVWDFLEMQPGDPESWYPGKVATLPGYTRGLAFHDRYAFVGRSRIRETSTFGGLPISQRSEDLKSGVWAVDFESP